MDKAISGNTIYRNETHDTLPVHTKHRIEIRRIGNNVVYNDQQIVRKPFVTISEPSKH